MVEVLGVDRRQVRPATSLSKLLPQYGWRTKWKRLERSMGLRLPPLTQLIWFPRPGRPLTVGDLARQVLAFNHARFRSRTNPGEVWQSLKLIIVKQLGVSPDEITPAASFTEDLRVD